jgi:hypothetical protein
MGKESFPGFVEDALICKKAAISRLGRFYISF